MMTDSTTAASLLLVVPAIDHAAKAIVRRHVAHQPVSLGILGELRIVHANLWAHRLRPALSLRGLWLVWAAAAAGSVVLAILVPATLWPLAVILGGALSHAIEVSTRGVICDFVCLRFWPAFNLADVALAGGTLALLYELVRASW